MPSEAAETRLLERKVFICVPVPGESAWLQASDARPAAPSFPPASSSRGKRGRGGESDEDVSMSIADSAGASAAGAGDVADSLDSKRVRPRDGEARRLLCQLSFIHGAMHEWRFFLHGGVGLCVGSLWRPRGA